MKERILFFLTALLLTLSQHCAADTFTYDALNRLTRVAFANGAAIDYAYDAVGNLLSTVNSGFLSHPDAPTAAAATPGSGSANINFTAPANNGGSAITGYTATSTPSGFTGSCTAPCSSITVNGLTNGTAYTFTVTATNSVGTSAASTSSNSVTPSVPDTQAPSMPGGPMATVVSSSQINLAWGASTDNVGVTQYKIHSNNVEYVVYGAPPATNYSVTGLRASTLYGYSVRACDAAGNCSYPSPTTLATTLAEGGLSFTPYLVPGWNLLGNSLNITLDAATVFGTPTAPVPGVSMNIVSIWKWDAANSVWAYYSPQLTAAQINSFTASKGYRVWSGIGPGEGYWVNASNAFTMPAQSGAEFSYTSVTYQPLPSAWNLVATAQNVYPTSFANTVSNLVLPAGGANTADTFVSLWAWDAARWAWYFYSPALENFGGLAAVQNYATSKGYLHFQDFDKKLDLGIGFWVNKP